MVQVRSNPAASPGYVIITENNNRLEGASTTKNNKPVDLAELVQEFPWLNGIKFANKNAPFPDNFSLNNDTTSDTQITPTLQGLHDFPRLYASSMSEFDVNGNTQARLPWRMISNSVSEKDVGTIIQGHPAVPEHAMEESHASHGPELNSAMPPHPNDPTQQTKPSFFNASTQGCPPKHIFVQQ